MVYYRLHLLGDILNFGSKKLIVYRMPNLHKLSKPVR